MSKENSTKKSLKPAPNAVTSFKMDWCSHAAAKFACENWHYSKCMPAGKAVKIGVWENDMFVGVLIFSRGASPCLLKPYGLSQFEGCELTRIALKDHKTPVTRMIAIAIKMLKKLSEGLRLIVSFADVRQNHHGGIYQGSNWIYTGLSQQGGALEYLIDGKWTHHRSIGAKYGYAGKAFASKYNVQTRKPTRKHCYLYPLDKDMSEKVKRLAKSYPKRAGSKDNVAAGPQPAEGGVNPTPALQE